MIKLFKKLVDWCFEAPANKDEIFIDNKFYIPASQVFCYTAKEREMVKTKK